MPVLSAEITVDYPQKNGVLRGARLEVFPGEILGLVGQSGSGKSTLALSLLRLLGHAGARVSGRTTLLGRDLEACSERELREIRGRIVSFIPQSPALALNPALRIETQLREAWRAHADEPWPRQKERVVNLMRIAGLPLEEAFLKRYPKQISVGQAQRVLIVMALLHLPALLIADEPTSALDPITQREVLDLLVSIVKQGEMSMLFISHDLIAVASICDRIAILFDGEIVECAPTRDVIAAPHHPYTKGLITAVCKRGLIYQDGNAAF